MGLIKDSQPIWALLNACVALCLMNVNVGHNNLMNQGCASCKLVLESLFPFGKKSPIVASIKTMTTQS